MTGIRCRPASALAAEKVDLVAFVLEPHRHALVGVVEEADHADGGGGEDRALRGLVVERDVAGDDGGAEGFAGVGQAFDGAAELPEVVGLFGVGEVQAVGDGSGVAPTQERLRAASATAIWAPT